MNEEKPRPRITDHPLTRKYMQLITKTLVSAKTSLEYSAKKTNGRNENVITPEDVKKPRFFKPTLLENEGVSLRHEIRQEEPKQRLVNLPFDHRDILARRRSNLLNNIKTEPEESIVGEEGSFTARRKLLLNETSRDDHGTFSTFMESFCENSPRVGNSSYLDASDPTMNAYVRQNLYTLSDSLPEVLIDYEQPLHIRPYSDIFIKREPSSSSTESTGDLLSLLSDDECYNYSSLTDKSVDPAPLYRLYQLMGDSQFLRFSKYINQSSSSVRKIQYAVSGQTIRDLYELLCQGKHPIHDRVILMIGTNNLVRRTPSLSEMKKIYSLIIGMLKSRVKQLILVTLPPVPLHKSDPKHWLTWNSFNDFIERVANGPNVKFADFGSKTLISKDIVNTNLFELSYEGSGNIDLIHLNKNGFNLLKNVLDTVCCDEVR